MIGAATVGQGFALTGGPAPRAGGAFQLRPPPSPLGGGLLGAVTRAPGFRLSGFRLPQAAQTLQFHFNKALERVVCWTHLTPHDARMRARAYIGVIVSQHQTDARCRSHEDLNTGHEQSLANEPAGVGLSVVPGWDGGSTFPISDSVPVKVRRRR